MERTRQENSAELSGILLEIEQGLEGALGSRSLAEFFSQNYNLGEPHSLKVTRDENYTLYTETAEGVAREITTFPGGTWQIKLSFDYKDSRPPATSFMVASKQPSGIINVSGELPIGLVETYLYETSPNEIDKYRSLLFESIFQIKQKAGKIRCYLSNDQEAHLGLPLKI